MNIHPGEFILPKVRHLLTDFVNLAGHRTHHPMAPPEALAHPTLRFSLTIAILQPHNCIPEQKS